MQSKFKINELIEFASPEGDSSRVTVEESGAVRIKGAKLLGTESRNVNDDGTRNRYPAANIAKWAPRYEGVPIYADHSRDDGTRSVHDKIGKVHNVVARENGLYGDLLLAPGPNADRVAWAAQHCPDFFAMSHHARGLGLREEESDYTTVEDIETVYSVDLVVAGGTTNSLYEDHNPMTESTPTPAEAEVVVEAEVVAVATCEHEDLTAKVEALEAEIAALKAEKDQVAKEARREKMIADSRIPGDKQSVTFRESVMSATSDEQAKEIIEDRKRLVFHQEPEGAVVQESATSDTHTPDKFLNWIEA